MALKRGYLEKLEWLYLTGVCAVSHKTDLEGIQVYVLLPEDQESAFAKIGEALGLIRQYDPARFDRFRRGFDRILVAEAGGALAAANLRRRLCKLDWKYLDDPATRPEGLAATLVHEATHAHVHARGIEYRDGRRLRIENVCISAEIAFLRRLPQWHAEAARRSFRGRNHDETVFSERGDLERRLAALEDREAPRWLVAAMRWRGERRLAKRDVTLDA